MQNAYVLLRYQNQQRSSRKEQAKINIFFTALPGGNDV